MLCSHLAGHHQSWVWPGTPHGPPNPCPVLTPPSADSAAYHLVSPSAAR
jgi:hypothetical protein